MCNVVRYIFVGFFVAICSVASCFELSSSAETIPSNIKPSDLTNKDEGTTNLNKRQLLPLPRAGRSAQGMLPMPRTGRSNGLLPIMRTGRSEGILPMMRTGRSTDQGLVPMPRAGRSDGMLPFPRAGRSEGMLPFPRAGRSDGVLPFPRAGRSDGMLPFPRAGRSEGMLPFPRAGRSDNQGLLPMPRAGRSDPGMLPMPRAGRSDGMLPFPRAGRSEGILPFPRTGRSQSTLLNEDLFSRYDRSTDGLVPMPRAGRSLPSSAFYSPDCMDSIECSEMHESPSVNSDDDSNDNLGYEKSERSSFLDRSKRSLNEALDKDVKNETTLVKTSPAQPLNASTSLTSETDEFALNGMIIVLEPKPKTDVAHDVIESYDDDRVGRGLERHWIEFEKGFSFRYPTPFRPLLSMSPGSPSSNFFSNSLEDEIGPNILDPIDLQLRAVYIPRIGKRAGQTGVFGLPDWFKRTGTSGSGPTFQPRIGRSSFFQPRTGRSMSGSDDQDDAGVDDIIFGARPERSSFTPRIGRSVKGQPRQTNDEKTIQSSS